MRQHTYCTFMAGWAVVSLCLLLTASLRAGEYQVDRSVSNSVIFVSDAPLEDFEGVTDAIDGFVILNCDDLTQGDECTGGEFYFEVDLASLDTGIGLRNRHMRNNYLETDEFPYARFSGTVEHLEHRSKENYTVTMTGTMSIHGVDREMEITGEVTSQGTGYRVLSNFTVSLPDFDIDVPSLMFMKISDEIVLKLDFVVKPVATQQESEKK